MVSHLILQKKAELDGKQTSGSRELGDQQEGTKPFWRVVELSMLSLAVVTMNLTFIKLIELNTSQEQIDRM